jgi:hypothetical protein
MVTYVVSLKVCTNIIIEFDVYKHPYKGLFGIV